MEDVERKKLISRSGVKGNVRYITITDNVPEHWDALISIAKTYYTWWAYIYHDKDDTSKHLHLLCYDKGGTNLKSHCNRFSSVVTSNFVEKVWSGRAMARYLIHKDDPQKHQYLPSEVFTSSVDRYERFLLDERKDILQLYKDFSAVSNGFMPVEEFIEKYRGEIADLPFSQQIGVIAKITNYLPYRSIQNGSKKN